MVVAVEPSKEMISKRPETSASAVRQRAAAEYPPFPSETFDAAMAVLTVHHCRDWRQGLAEMQRVSRAPK